MRDETAFFIAGCYFGYVGASFISLLLIIMAVLTAYYGDKAK